MRAPATGTAEAIRQAAPGRFWRRHAALGAALGVHDLYLGIAVIERHTVSSGRGFACGADDELAPARAPARGARCAPAGWEREKAAARKPVRSRQPCRRGKLRWLRLVRYEFPG